MRSSNSASRWSRSGGSISSQPDLVEEDRGLAPHQLLGDLVDLLEDLPRFESRRRADSQPGRDAALEAGDPDHEELVEVVAEDRQELDALEQRHVLVHGELQDALVELQPGELALEEAVGGERRGVRGAHELPVGPACRVATMHRDGAREGPHG